MTHELIIDGHRVDLTGDPITLQWVSGLFRDVGSITLSHSYTIQLPKTAHNLRIFDDPENIGHRSTKTRRYLAAEYIRDGVSLIGDGRAYVSGVTSSAIEIVLLWQASDALLAWRDADLGLQDLPNLGVLTPWINTSTGLPNYKRSGDPFFAKYYAGLGEYKYPQVLVATGPAVGFATLVNRILTTAGVSYEIDSTATSRLNSVVLLADGRRPSKDMDLASGSYTSGAGSVLSTDRRSLAFTGWTHAWDRTLEVMPTSDPRNLFSTQSTYDDEAHDSIYIKASLRNRTPGAYSLMGNALQVIGYYLNGFIVGEKVLAEYPFQEDADGYEFCQIDALLEDLGDMLELEFRYKNAISSTSYGGLVAYQGSEALRVSYKHETINLGPQNSFPVALNLPDMSQVAFVKGACALLGLLPIMEGDTLKITTYDNILDPSRALDWTHKMQGSPEKTALRYENLSRRNGIVYKADKTVVGSYDAAIHVDDATLPEYSKLYELPFGASDGSQALQYSVTPKSDSEGVVTYELEDESIAPRVFEALTDKEGARYLEFPDRLKGSALVSAYYSRFQEVVRHPVEIEAVLKLSDVDLATLDFTRPVYFAQLGLYFAIKSVQDDGDGLSKTTLIQI